VLVVGLNSDASVGRIKGPGRPINRLEDRAEVLSALSCVDLVVPFDEDSPGELIRLLRPDVFVKGADYTVEALPEAAIVREYGGEVRLLPYVSERSTTGIIERIRAAAREEAARDAPVPAAGSRGGRT
jgi:D-beta-D-heptose 7-phosphate kinase/D-beta-D-heptose 1-phosphate adenosyltransferase